MQPLPRRDLFGHRGENPIAMIPSSTDPFGGKGIAMNPPRLFSNSSDRLPRTRFRPRIEGLDDRSIPAVGALFHVNTTVVGDQANSAVAFSSGGRSVVVWQSAVSATDHNIYGQMYSATGAKLGSQISIATGVRNQINPAVAMDSKGNFTAVWEERYLDRGNIRARRFSNAGGGIGAVIEVANTTLDEKAPSIGMIDKANAVNEGQFVVSYTVGTGVRTDMFSKFGFRIKRFDVGASLGDANSTRGESTAARSADGSFMIGFIVRDPDGTTWWDSTPTELTSVYVDRYRADGTFLSRLKLGSGKIIFGYALTMDAQGHGRYAFSQEYLDAIDGPIADVVVTGRIDKLGKLIEAKEVWVGNGTWIPRDIQIASNPTDKGFVISFTQTAAAIPSTLKDRVILIEGLPNGLVRTSDLGANHNQSGIAIGPKNIYLLTYTTTVSTAADPKKGIFGRFGRLA